MLWIVIINHVIVIIFIKMVICIQYIDILLYKEFIMNLSERSSKENTMNASES